MKPSHPFVFTAAYPLCAVAAPPPARLAIRHDANGKSRVVAVRLGNEQTLAGPMPIGNAVREYSRLRRVVG